MFDAASTSSGASTSLGAGSDRGSDLSGGPTDPACLGGTHPTYPQVPSLEDGTFRQWGSPPPGAAEDHPVGSVRSEQPGLASLGTDDQPVSSVRPEQPGFALVGTDGELVRGGLPPVVEAEAGVVFSWMIRNQHGLHARPAAQLVAGLRGIDAAVEVSNATSGRGPVSARRLTSVQTLGLRQGDVMAVRITGAEAEAAYQRLVQLAETDFGERDPGKPREPPSNWLPLRQGDTVTPPVGGSALADGGEPATRRDDHPSSTVGQAGTTGSSGRTPSSADPGRDGRQIVIGTARQVVVTPDVSHYVAGDPASEVARLEAAVKTVAQTLRQLDDQSDLGIYSVQLLTLTDEDTLGELRTAITAGMSAVEAVGQHFAAVAAEFEAINDPYLRARAEDQRGLQRMLWRALTGQAVLPALVGGVLILDELDPVTAGSLDPARCQGIITTSGGATGHGAILAQARGFALLTGRADARDIADGTTVALDPVATRLWVAPTPTEMAELTKRQAARRADTVTAAQLAHEPALTRTGTRILVEANVAAVTEAADGLAAGAEGSGLVRTEVLFGTSDHAPAAEEQAATFVRIGRALGGQMITIRTWDPGGDKPLPFLPQDPEANPMLGERGIRAMRRLPELLDTQLTAILLASRETAVRVMFPMITLPEEMAWARERLAAAEARVGARISAGMMVETPAAALRAPDFRELADFISVGTNDLTQYTLAVDRGNPGVAGLAQGGNAPVWDLISLAARAFAGRPVAVCGDLASHPDAVARLIGLGVTELSVRPPLVGVIKQAVRAT
ncbi:MAG: HPr family phosphocarrier protein [Propionibacteriaceae bacterium]|nr:HPr family phosphocarrier protein [Propionibacteriaceae bacterium]